MGVSFVSIFIVSYHLVFWVCGAAHSLSWDYLPEIPQGQQAEKHYSWREKPLGALLTRYIQREASAAATMPAAAVPFGSRADTLTEKEEDKHREDMTLHYEATQTLAVDIEGDPDVQLVRRTSHLSCGPQRPRGDGPQSLLLDPAKDDSTPTLAATSLRRLHRFVPSIVVRTLSPLGAIVTPVTVTIAVALPIALIKPLKALFVDTSSMGGPNWKGPDGKPPLAFIMDTGENSAPYWSLV